MNLAHTLHRVEQQTASGNETRHEEEVRKREGTRPASQPPSHPARHARGDVERSKGCWRGCRRLRSHWFCLDRVETSCGIVLRSPLIFHRAFVRAPNFPFLLRSLLLVSLRRNLLPASPPTCFERAWIWFRIFSRINIGSRWSSQIFYPSNFLPSFRLQIRCCCESTLWVSSQQCTVQVKGFARTREILALSLRSVFEGKKWRGRRCEGISMAGSGWIMDSVEFLDAFWYV